MSHVCLFVFDESVSPGGPRHRSGSYNCMAQYWFEYWFEFDPRRYPLQNCRRVDATHLAGKVGTARMSFADVDDHHADPVIVLAHRRVTRVMEERKKKAYTIELAP